MIRFYRIASACLLTAAIVLAAAAPVYTQRSKTMTVKLYFLNEKSDPGLMDCQAVKPVNRTIPRTEGVARAALLELFKGVTSEEAAAGFVSIDPGSTTGILKSIKIKSGSAFINFDKIVYEKLGVATTSCGGGLFSSIEGTLTQFKTIKKGKVFYAIEGSPRDFYEWVQVGECPDELKDCDGRNF